MDYICLQNATHPQHPSFSDLVKQKCNEESYLNNHLMSVCTKFLQHNDYCVWLIFLRIQCIKQESNQDINLSYHLIVNQESLYFQREKSCKL